MTLPWRGSLVAIERIMAPLPQLLAAQLAEYTVDGDRGVAKPLMTLDGTPFDLEPMQKEPVMQPNSRRAQAGIYRAILASAWG
jgi:hypothetical protein